MKNQQKKSVKKSNNNILKVYTIYNDYHEILFKDFFLPSFNKINTGNLELIAKKINLAAADIDEVDNYLKVSLYKINFIIGLIKKNKGKIFVFCDVDIQYFRNFYYDIIKELGVLDAVFQEDLKGEVCGGFFCINANERTLRFFQKTLRDIPKFIDKTFDQASMNHHLDEIKYKLLPQEKYFTVDYFYNKPKAWFAFKKIKKNIILHHGNSVIGINNKIALMRSIKRSILENRPILFYNVKFKYYHLNQFYKLLGKFGIYIKKNMPFLYKALKPYFPDKKHDHIL